MDGKKRGEKERSRESVCIQMWDTTRWITQLNGQFVTVREVGRKEQREGREGR